MTDTEIDQIKTGASTLRHRRTLSDTRAEEIHSNESRVRRQQPDNPIHRPRDSIFACRNSELQDFTGFVNWAFLILTLGGIRLFLENFLKYGIRVDPSQWFIILSTRNQSGFDYHSPIMALYASTPVLCCYSLELAMANNLICNKFGLILQIINLLIVVLIPLLVIHVYGATFSLIGSAWVCFVYCIIFLKLWSYVHVNLWCRRSSQAQIIHPTGMNGVAYRSDNIGDTIDHNHRRTKSRSILEPGSRRNSFSGIMQPLVVYPDNLTIMDLVYFMFAPTLCYELNFPRTARIRKRFLIKRLFEVGLGIHIVLCLIQQYMIPSVKNSLIPFSNMDVPKAIERLLKLAIPNHLIWLCSFYLFFHSFLNLLGEIMYFADRNFYCDWWNANNINVFWRTWNMPVHRWALRHLYFPILEMGYDKNVAVVMVFFISAFFHEYLLSAPLKAFKIWAFLAMMLQIPMCCVSSQIERHFGSKWGNVVVWASIIVGQPLCIMIYYHDYVITNYGRELIEVYSHV